MGRPKSGFAVQLRNSDGPALASRFATKTPLV
jgi:hypothetical protein